MFLSPFCNICCWAVCLQKAYILVCCCVLTLCETLHFNNCYIWNIFAHFNFLMSLCCTFFVFLSFVFIPLSDLEIVAFMGKLKTLLRHSIQLNKNQFYPDNVWMPWSLNVEMPWFLPLQAPLSPSIVNFKSDSLQVWKWWFPCSSSLPSLLLTLFPVIFQVI